MGLLGDGYNELYLWAIGDLKHFKRAGLRRPNFDDRSFKSGPWNWPRRLPNFREQLKDQNLSDMVTHLKYSCLKAVRLQCKNIACLDTKKKMDLTALGIIFESHILAFLPLNIIRHQPWPHGLKTCSVKRKRWKRGDSAFQRLVPSKNKLLGWLAGKN